MALIYCPECGKQASDRASKCIHCGYPIAETKDKNKLSGKKIVIEFNGAKSSANSKSLMFVKKPDKKILLIVFAVVVIIVGVILILTIASTDKEKSTDKYFAQEIVLDKVHKLNGIGELEIKRVSTTKLLYDELPENMVGVDFECVFTNTMGTKYDVSKFATVVAKSKKTDAEYTECKIRLAEPRDYELVIEPYIKTRIHFIVQVPEDEEELIVTFDFGENNVSFEYTVGDLIRNTKEFKVGEVHEVDAVARVALKNVVYSNGLWAPKPAYGNTHHGSEVENSNESVYLIFDVDYTNLKNANECPSDAVEFEAIYDEYHYTEGMCFLLNEHTIIQELYSHDSLFITGSKRKVFFVVEVSRKMIDKEVEFDLFIGDKEFVYKGTPEYVADYGI